MNARKPWSNLICIFYDFKKVANMQFKKRFNQKMFRRGTKLQAEILTMKSLSEVKRKGHRRVQRIFNINKRHFLWQDMHYKIK